MAELVHRLDIQSVTIRLRLPHLFGVRMWVGQMLFRAGAAVIGCGIIVESEETRR